MVQYYNLSLFSEGTGMFSIYSVMDTLLIGYFSLFLVIVIGMFVAGMRMKKGDNTLNALMLGSFWSMMMALVLYVGNVFYSGITKPGLYIFVPAIIFIVTIAVTWYNNR